MPRFLAPGNFNTGIADRPDVQEMLLSLGYPWAATKYPSMKLQSGSPSTADIDTIVAVQKKTQPFVYPSGSVEVSGYPPTDVHAFRTGTPNVQWAIKHRAMYKLALHPSIMYVEDPQFKTVNLICDLANAAAGGRAAIVDLGTFARRTKLRQKTTE